jgi:formamidopyrimidine-DNA glycosylase
VVAVAVLRGDLVPQGASHFQAGLEGRRILRVERRGKNVVVRLEGGRVLLVNLGMTGRLLAAPTGTAGTASTHPGVVFRLDDGLRVIYDDVRRFGCLEALGAAGWQERTRRLGPEPLAAGFTAATLAAGLASSRSPIRSWLLDQRRIAGVGNIYANEALWQARVHPLRAASSLAPGEVRSLHRALRRVLRAAIRARGTTLRDYRDASGGEGSFGPLLRVYGREGDACPRCGATVERRVLSNRSTFFCPRCQLPD